MYITHNNPSRHDRELTPGEQDAFAAELDAIGQQHRALIGEADARYIRRLRAVVRCMELVGRALLFFGFFPPTWIAGTVLLGLAHILDNMELGHNVMHGQYNFMNDPAFYGRNYDWANVCPGDFWRETHNHQHHTYANVIGKDDDVGYGVVRLFPEQKWHPFYRWQVLTVTLQALLFEWAVGIQDLQLKRQLKGKPVPGFDEKLQKFKRKATQVALKEYVLLPLLAWHNWAAVMAGNFVASLIRNVWAFAVIFCGHFTEKAAVFPLQALDNETRGQWYLRQLKGSSNMSGGTLFHIMAGNLSHQIEHHLFPDIPARRYADMAPQVRAVCERYGQGYNTAPMASQFATVMVRVWRYRKPNSQIKGEVLV
jgi:NADPH-dependent stearoyl-CoA 9-desaturase